MTGRTHDLAALTAVLAVAAFRPLPKLSALTVGAALAATFLGSLAPDLDQPTHRFWRRVPAGTLIGRLVQPLLGGHRHLSHSLLGLALAALITRWLFLLQPYVPAYVDARVVWYAFLLAYASHILMDALTKDGVPLLFPWALSFGFPPLARWRVRTGSWREYLLVVPALVVILTWVVTTRLEPLVAALR